MVVMMPNKITYPILIIPNIPKKEAIVQATDYIIINKIQDFYPVVPIPNFPIFTHPLNPPFGKKLKKI